MSIPRSSSRTAWESKWAILLTQARSGSASETPHSCQAAQAPGADLAYLLAELAGADHGLHDSNALGRVAVRADRRNCGSAGL